MLASSAWCLPAPCCLRRAARTAAAPPSLACPASPLALRGAGAAACCSLGALTVRTSGVGREEELFSSRGDGEGTPGNGFAYIRPVRHDVSSRWGWCAAGFCHGGESVRARGGRGRGGG